MDLKSVLNLTNKAVNIPGFFSIGDPVDKIWTMQVSNNNY